MTIPPIKPVYGVYDFDGQVVLPPGPQPPTTPIEGSMYASGGFVYVWHDSAWVEIGAGGGEVGTGVAIIQPEPPDPTGLPEGTWWVDEDSSTEATGVQLVQDEGNPLTARTVMNFTGDGVTALDDAANSRIVVTIPGSGGGGSTVIVQPEPPDPTGLPEGTQWVDEDSDIASNLPPGGTTDQVLAKASNADYDLEWATAAASGDPAGTAAAAVLAHEQAADAHPGYLTQAEADALYTAAGVTSGSTILSGTAAPAAGTGADGNYYLDTDDRVLYGPKSGSGSYGTGVSAFTSQLPTWATYKTPRTTGHDFQFTNEGRITGLRYYRDVQSSYSSRTLKAWDNGVLVATATTSGDSGSGWKTAVLSTPLVVAAGKTLRVAVTPAPDTDIISITDPRPAEVITNAGITIMNTGTYDAPSDVYPTNSTPALYFVDVLFEPLGSPWPVAIKSVPPGGTTSQVLAKSSATDYATSWTTPSSGGASTLDGLTDVTTTGVTNGQVLGYAYGAYVWVGLPTTVTESGHNGADPAANVWDNNDATLWATGTAVGVGIAWSIADFGVPITAARIFAVSSTVGDTWRLEASSNGSSWTTIVASVVASTGVGNTYDFTAATYRYWRIIQVVEAAWRDPKSFTLYNPNPQWQPVTPAAGGGTVLPNGTAAKDMIRWSMGGLLAQIDYSTLGANGLINWCRGNSVTLTATQGSNIDGVRLAANAIDGSLNTQAHTNNFANSWWQVDFGATRAVVPTSFGLGGRNESGNFPRYYQIQGSNDGSTWTVLYDTAGTPNQVPMNAWLNIPTPSVTVAYRYFRMWQTGAESSGTNYLVLGDFEVYGELGVAGGADPGWVVEADAPSDGKPYARKSSAWAEIPNILVLGPADPVPGGTPAGTVIIRTVS